MTDTDTKTAAEAKTEVVEEAPKDVKSEEAEAPKEMRAVILNGFGGLKCVKIVRRPHPALADGEVLVRVQLCGVSFQDVMVRQGFTEAPPKIPFILGFECAGVVEAVADDVNNFKVGDRVVALPDHRAWAELVPVPAKYVYAVPEAMPLQEAIAVTVSYTVAYMLIHDLGNISSGHTVLVHSAGGSVGQAICSLLRNMGGITIIGVASKTKHEDIKDSVTHLIDRGSDTPTEVRKVCPDGVDIVLDCQGGEECNKGYSLLKPLGRYILFGPSSIVTGETKSILSVIKSWRQVDKVSPLRLYEDNRAIFGFNLRRLLYQQAGGHERVRCVVEEVYKLWQSGVAKACIDSTFALEDVTEAMMKMHERRNVGKLLLDLSMEPKAVPTTPGKGKKEEKKDEGKKEEKKEETKKEKKDEGKKEDDETKGEKETDLVKSDEVKAEGK
ncbi:synaptic vesicle membrane protein VAT-1 homolog-like [Procambarus clarkii]|uniref:synaptic vesicle membrane protein VAT-1 homolog-like n=1 Tax=Procambarus clarkii TaxID=6728 RepID=UPI001E6786E7|nr:synaptic vesicle membrane protein VAT-1 homolog-like [Procambarus clarkii]